MTNFTEKMYCQGVTSRIGREVGYGLKKDETSVSPRYGTVVKLVKVSDNPNDDVLILTAYPINAR